MTTTQTTAPAGWIYVIHTRTDPNAYIGQTVQPPGLRIERHRRTQDWGGQILPGRDGYTIIRRVESHGDPAVDAIALDLAEAEEIHRRNPTNNTNRPDPAVFYARMADALRATPTGNPTPHTPRPTRKPRGVRPRGVTAHRGGSRAGVRRRTPWGLILRIPVGILWAWAFLRVGVNVAHETGDGWWPWVMTPVAFLVGPVLTVGVLRSWGWLPQRRRSRRRY